MLPKDSKNFPVKDNYLYLNNCGVAPLYAPAARAAANFKETRTQLGAAVFLEHGSILPDLHVAAARLLNTASDNVAFTKNTAEGMSMIANGFRFSRGDEIVSYTHEYPSNHYPWLLQEGRGVRLRLLPNRRLDAAESDLPGPSGFSMEDLEELVNSRTRIVAVSHVQFTSGFAADLKVLGDFCQERSIDLVVDAAQSLGCLPVDMQAHGIAAVAASGWKWLMGPVGTGLLATTPEFRAKIATTMAGAEVVVQGDDYLNHTWEPHTTAARFEYSTTQVADAIALTTCLTELFAPPTEADNTRRDGSTGAVTTIKRSGVIRDENLSLQDALIAEVDLSLLAPVQFPAEHRSGILALLPVFAEVEQAQDAARMLSRRLLKEGVMATARGGYLRAAPHFYMTTDEARRAGAVLNRVAAEVREL